MGILIPSTPCATFFKASIPCAKIVYKTKTSHLRKASKLCLLSHISHFLDCAVMHNPEILIKCLLKTKLIIVEKVLVPVNYVHSS